MNRRLGQRRTLERREAKRGVTVRHDDTDVKTIKRIRLGQAAKTRKS